MSPWLEGIPTAMKKQLAYAVVCPDSALEKSVATFFEQLAVMYRACRLGTLKPIANWMHRFKAPDGSVSEEASVQARDCCVWHAVSHAIAIPPTA